jgi:uncharacterized coiled-coil DUF342 family protein
MKFRKKPVVIEAFAVTIELFKQCQEERDQLKAEVARLRDAHSELKATLSVTRRTLEALVKKQVLSVYAEDIVMSEMMHISNALKGDGE